MTNEEIQKALDHPFTDPDLGEMTIRKYLKELLRNLIGQGEGFSGKRPFGNSGWQNFAAVPLIQVGLLEGDIDEDGYAEVTGKNYREILYTLINSL